jgi:hypothetical protein
MHTRKYQKSDREELESIFRKQGLPYELPNLDSNNFIARRVLVDENGRPAQALAARLTTELYLLVDPDWDTPGWRLEGIRMLGRSMQTELREKGITDAHLWLPPQKKSFERRLMKTFGFTRPEWANFVRMV